jgi:ABC-type protease/lipase transport system fused ATPase/permease subunit
VILGLGAYLVIRQEASAGVIIASSILTSRALAPVDLVISNWKGFVGAREARKRLDQLLTLLLARRLPLPLPHPNESLAVRANRWLGPGHRACRRCGLTSSVQCRSEALET